MLRIFAVFLIALVWAVPARAENFTLPEGFTATVFADDLGYARHLAVRQDGAVYTILRRRGFFGGGGGRKAAEGGRPAARG